MTTPEIPYENLNIAYPTWRRILFEPLELILSLWDCIAGEILVTNECQVCPDQTFTPIARNDSCVNPCPEGALCKGSN